MATELLERPRTIPIQSASPNRPASSADVEPNFGPEDMHAIRVIAYLMIGIFSVALVMYGTITIFAWLGS
jgi:hypothetical protein